MKLLQITMILFSIIALSSFSQNSSSVLINYPYLKTSEVLKDGNISFRHIRIDSQSSANDVCNKILNTDLPSFGFNAKFSEVSKKSRRYLINKDSTELIKNKSGSIYSSIVCSHARKENFHDYEHFLNSSNQSNVFRIRNLELLDSSGNLTLDENSGGSSDIKIGAFELSKKNGQWIDVDSELNLLFNPRELIEVKNKNKLVYVFIDTSNSVRGLEREMNKSLDILHAKYQKQLIVFNMSNLDSVENAVEFAQKTETEHVYILSDGFWEELTSKSMINRPGYTYYPEDIQTQRLDLFDTKVKLKKLLENNDESIKRVEKIKLLEKNLVNQTKALEYNLELPERNEAILESYLDLQLKSKITHFTLVGNEVGTKTYSKAEYVQDIIILGLEKYGLSLQFFGSNPDVINYLNKVF